MYTRRLLVESQTFVSRQTISVLRACTDDKMDLIAYIAHGGRLPWASIPHLGVERTRRAPEGQFSCIKNAAVFTYVNQFMHLYNRAEVHDTVLTIRAVA